VAHRARMGAFLWLSRRPCLARKKGGSTASAATSSWDIQPLLQCSQTTFAEVCSLAVPTQLWSCVARRRVGMVQEPLAVEMWGQPVADHVLARERVRTVLAPPAHALLSRAGRGHGATTLACVDEEAVGEPADPGDNVADDGSSPRVHLLRGNRVEDHKGARLAQVVARARAAWDRPPDWA